MVTTNQGVWLPIWLWGRRGRVRYQVVQSPEHVRDCDDADLCNYTEAVREFRKAFIATVLRENNGNQSKAARELGMHRNTLTPHGFRLET